MKKKEDSKNYLKKFWNYLWYDDSLGSYVLNFIVALVFIKYIFFPIIGLMLGTNIPVVAIVSGSMEHKVVDGQVCGNTLQNQNTYSLDYNQWWNFCGEYYQDNFNIGKDEFKNFDFTNGLNIGDVIILTGEESEDINVGDVLVFRPGNMEWFQRNGPVIHRVVDKYEKNGQIMFTTKGDQNPEVSSGNFERDITQDQIYATAEFRIPLIGYLKVFLVRLLGVFS